MDADVHARERDGTRQQEQRRPESRERKREQRCGGEARRSVPGRKRCVVRRLHQRFRLRVPQRRPLPIDDRLQARRRPVGDRDGDHRRCQDAPAPIEDRQDERERDPEQTEPPRIRQSLEDRAQPPGAVVNHPTLDVAIRGDQAGTICFVWSISARRSKGLPTNPCAPRWAASSPASSCPLNMTTGMEPTPCRS